MNEKVNINKDYICKICNKKYSSLNSLCNHNKKFHNINSKHEVNISKHKINIGKHEVNISKHQINTCKYCNKIFSCKQSRWRHEKTCKHLDTNKIDQLEEKNKKLEETINEMKEQFALIIKEKGKIHHKTLQKINNQLNNNNINNGKIINNINNTYVKFGDLDYQKVLNNKQIKHILNHQYMSLEESIKQIHFNEELPEYNNIFIII